MKENTCYADGLLGQKRQDIQLQLICPFEGIMGKGPEGREEFGEGVRFNRQERSGEEVNSQEAKK